MTDLTIVGEGRETVLSPKLDRLFDSVFGLPAADLKGYLTTLKSMKITSDAEISSEVSEIDQSRASTRLDCGCKARGGCGDDLDCKAIDAEGV